MAAGTGLWRPVRYRLRMASMSVVTESTGDQVSQMMAQWAEILPVEASDAAEAAKRIVLAADEVGRAGQSALAAFEMSVPDFAVLSTILREGRPGGLPVGFLVQELLTEPQDLVVLLEQLEKGGLVLTTPLDDDGVAVSLTDTGRQRTTEVVRAHALAMRGFFGRLAPGELTSLNEAMKPVNALG